MDVQVRGRSVILDSSWPDGPLPLALPPKVALSPLSAVILSPPVTLQPAVLAGTTHVLAAVSPGSEPFWVELLFVSAKAVMVSTPGSAEV